MISYNQIVIQIEKQLHKAKLETNEQTTREAFAAIRALCEVALDSSTPVTPSSSFVQTNQVMSTQSTAVKEDDANGESLFDF
ncbi:YwdI family protein [Psychrobacillus vulpis]|uniref:Uracil-DNA glycosylase n=1 Tax=Psychrobacillus vulpis TaxID=2325572 RepID=A0A544TUH7_9BACI|nr:YwdI family protein [Psychrobacillus vulpis]TQR21109.1 uracil-DNA glycosylase [Psychrobacillus vulpis]